MYSYKDIFNRIKIIETKHLLEKRNNSSVMRSQFEGIDILKKITKVAFDNGLTSFRNKGLIVISVGTFSGGTLSFLVNLQDDNLTFITIFFSRTLYYYNFKTVHNRINCFNYIVKRLTPEQKLKTQKEKIFKSIDIFEQNELKVFDTYVNTCNIMKLK